jgi:hypothetical protein
VDDDRQWDGSARGDGMGQADAAQQITQAAIQRAKVNDEPDEKPKLIEQAPFTHDSPHHFREDSWYQSVYLFSYSRIISKNEFVPSNEALRLRAGAGSLANKRVSRTPVIQ